MTFEQRQADIFERRMARCRAILHAREESILRLATTPLALRHRDQWFRASRRFADAQEARHTLDRAIAPRTTRPDPQDPDVDGDRRLVEQGARSQQSIDWAGEEEERHA